MALDNFPGCRFTIWRYLEREERAFLAEVLNLATLEPDGESVKIANIAYFAVRHGWLSALEHLRPAIRDEHGAVRWELLSVAADTGNVETLKLLQSCGPVDMDIVLSRAAWQNQHDVVTYALENGATRFDAVFERAFARGDLDLAKEMKRRNGKEFEKELLQVAQSNAAGNGCMAAILEAKKWEGFSPNDVLRGAAWGNKLKIMELALECGADEIGDAIVEAGRSGSTEAAALLISRGADPESIKHAFWWAVDQSRPGTAAYLKSKIQLSGEELQIGLDNSSHALSVELMKLFCNWGATDLDSALGIVVRRTGPRWSGDGFDFKGCLTFLKKQGVAREKFAAAALKAASSEVRNFLEGLSK